MCNISNQFLVHIGPHDVDEILDQRPNYQNQNFRPTGPVYPTHSTNDVGQHKAALGEGATLSCQINHNEPITWRRQDGRPLPSNSYVSGGNLILRDIQEDAAGLYECILQAEHGDYPLASTELIVVGKNLTTFNCTR